MGLVVFENNKPGLRGQADLGLRGHGPAGSGPAGSQGLRGQADLEFSY